MRLAGSFVLFSVLSYPAFAQVPLRPDDVVRVVSRLEPDRIEGSVIRLTRDTLYLESRDDARTLPNGTAAIRSVPIARADITTLERRKSGATQPVQGALIGAGVGLGMYLLIRGLEPGRGEYRGYVDYYAPRILIGTGVVLGAIIGSVSARHQWQPVDLGKIAPKLAVGRERVTLRWDFRF